MIGWRVWFRVMPVLGEPRQEDDVAIEAGSDKHRVRRQCRRGGYRQRRAQTGVRRGRGAGLGGGRGGRGGLGVGGVELGGELGSLQGPCPEWVGARAGCGSGAEAGPRRGVTAYGGATMFSMRQGCKCAGLNREEGSGWDPVRGGRGNGVGGVR